MACQFRIGLTVQPVSAKIPVKCFKGKEDGWPDGFKSTQHLYTEYRGQFSVYNDEGVNSPLWRSPWTKEWLVLIRRCNFGCKRLKTPPISCRPVLLVNGCRTDASQRRLEHKVVSWLIIREIKKLVQTFLQVYLMMKSRKLYRQ